MSEQEISKYRTVTACKLSELEEKMNVLVSEGYRYIGELNNPGGDFIIIMGLRSTPDLQLHEDFTNADIGSIQQHELEKAGYTAIANYSKHMTWAKPKVIKNG